MFLICSASRICGFCLLFSCYNIVLLSVRIFRISVVGHECFFKCCAMELVSERCIISLLHKVGEVKPTYILLFSEIQYPRGHLNWYTWCLQLISWLFFVQAFKIGVDSSKFSMLLLYILWDDWPIFMISGSNEQLQQQLEYTLLKPDCHSWWISKMQNVRTL